jgi:hypothetical protein
LWDGGGEIVGERGLPRRRQVTQEPLDGGDDRLQRAGRLVARFQSPQIMRKMFSARNA